MTMTALQFDRELVDVQLSVMILTIQILKDQGKFTGDDLTAAIDKAAATIQAGKA